MHWILQQNLLSQVTFSAMQDVLTMRGIRHTPVNLIPFVNMLHPDVDVSEESVFVYGSTGLGSVARAKGWLPGYFDEDLEYSLYLKHYGEEMLNHDAVVATLGQLERKWDQFFLRPTADSKQFAGEVMTWEKFEEFRNGVRTVEDAEGVTLTLQDTVIMAPIKEIRAEFRFFVIAGEVVTGSRYKIGNLVQSSTEIPEAMLVYARHQVSRWQPNSAFTLDVAETDEGPKIVELNSANSAGFYACDLGCIVDAVELLGQ